MRVSQQEFDLMTGLQEAGVNPPRVRRGKPENAVLTACLQWLWAHKVFAWRNNSGGYKTAHGAYVRYGYPGSPDILLIAHGGRWGGIECKAVGSYLGKSQKAFREKVEAAGGIYICARSTDDLEARRGEILG